MIDGENSVSPPACVAVAPDQMPLQKNLYNLISLYMVSLTQPKGKPRHPSRTWVFVACEIGYLVIKEWFYIFTLILLYVTKISQNITS